MRREHYPLQTLEDTASQLSGSTVFTSLDVGSVFRQVPLNQHSRELATFITSFWRFMLKRLPFGINSATVIFETEDDGYVPWGTMCRSDRGRHTMDKWLAVMVWNCLRTRLKPFWSWNLQRISLNWGPLMACFYIWGSLSHTSPQLWSQWQSFWRVTEPGYGVRCSRQHSTRWRSYLPSHRSWRFMTPARRLSWVPMRVHMDLVLCCYRRVKEISSLSLMLLEHSPTPRGNTPK